MLCCFHSGGGSLTHAALEDGVRGFRGDVMVPGPGRRKRECRRPGDRGTGPARTGLNTGPTLSRRFLTGAYGDEGSDRGVGHHGCQRQSAASVSDASQGYRIHEATGARRALRGICLWGSSDGRPGGMIFNFSEPVECGEVSGSARWQRVPRRRSARGAAALRLTRRLSRPTPPGSGKSPPSTAATDT